jgi:hypothetical protein
VPPLLLYIPQYVAKISIRWQRLEADAEDVGGAHLATVGEIHGLAAIPLHAEFDQEDSRFESLGYLERLLSIGRLRLRSPMSLYAVPSLTSRELQTFADMRHAIG